MATLPFPDIIPSTMSFGITYNTQINVSSLSGAVQTVEVPGARWTASMAFSDLEPSEGRVLAAFIGKMRGSSGRVFVTDFTHPAPRGSALGAPLVSGAGQSGTTLLTSGWTFPEVDVLLPGDYVEIPTTNGLSELKIITEAVSSTDGTATLTFEPPLRGTPTDTGIVKLINYTVKMLIDEDANSWTSDNPGLITDIQLSFTEAFG